MTAEALWVPSPERAMASNIAEFARTNGCPPDDYAALHRWSIDHPVDFWSAVWHFCGIVGEKGEEVLHPHPNMAAARFFPDAVLNVAENLLARLPVVQPALVAYTESGRATSVSGAELRAMVAATAHALREAGVERGDRVVVVLPNGTEAIVVMLAAASIGAVFASASPDFGVNAVLDRFGQIEPVAFYGCTEYTYSGQRIDCREKMSEIAAGLSTLRMRVSTGEQRIVGFVVWDELIADHADVPLHFEALPFDHPWYVLFSSGTTGKPKCIVHRAGGVLLTHAKEHRLHCDIRAGDVVTYYTTTGWMMWNWLASALATGATVVTYDGSPMYPTQHQLFDIADREGVTLLGVSAKYIDGLASNGLDIAGSHDVGALRTICSTGSPLSPRGFEYVYERVKRDVHLASISGGTDLCGCFIGGVPFLPVYSGELQAPQLGMAIEFVADDGTPLGVGDGPGELVCAQPFPSQPLGFWNDEPFGPDGSKYQATYYERFPGKWAHGDFASWTEHGGAIIHGRSDATLNPGGVRIGTADIYRVVEAIPQVAESIAFAQNIGSDVRIVLAVRLTDGVGLDDDLTSVIRSLVRSELSPRHVPAVIIAVDDLPRTFSGKLVELAVADAVNGRMVRNRDSIANPEAVDAIATHPDLNPI